MHQGVPGLPRMMQHLGFHMTLREQERRQRQHTASLPPAVQRAASVVPRPRKPYHRKTLTPEERERRKREREEERRRLQSEALKRGRIVVYPWTEWCAMRGVSMP